MGLLGTHVSAACREVRTGVSVCRPVRLAQGDAASEEERPGAGRAEILLVGGPGDVGEEVLWRVMRAMRRSGAVPAWFTTRTRLCAGATTRP